MSTVIWTTDQLPRRRVWTPREVAAIAKERAGNGLEAALELYRELVRQAISVQAPYAVTFVSGRKPRYRALTKAAPGAPPRRVSGNLLRRVARVFDRQRQIGRVFTDVDYGAMHELKNHKWLLPTLVKHLRALGLVAGAAMKVQVITRG